MVLGFEFGSWNLNIKLNLSTAALPGQTTKTALTEEFMFQNVAYRPTVYITGPSVLVKVVQDIDPKGGFRGANLLILWMLAPLGFIFVEKMW